MELVNWIVATYHAAAQRAYLFLRILLDVAGLRSGTYAVVGVSLDGPVPAWHAIGGSLRFGADHHGIFTNVDKAQDYCDWLNSPLERRSSPIGDARYHVIATKEK
jgi:hypothetical protein